MDYKVLYRKYRPSNFNELVGQEHIKKILVNSIINEKIAHAYIFTGPRGTGKTSTAKIFAKALNCMNVKDGISCGECDNCINFSTSPDVIEIDAASNNGVENIREIIENIGIAPSSSKYKIYIIDEVHMLSTSAWNAFLKTLEEPPSNVIFILATTDIQKVPITVLSRCQRFDFQRIDRELIYENIAKICDNESINYESEALKEIAYLSDGCMRDALSILDQLSKISSTVDMETLTQNYGTVSVSDIDSLYNSILHNDIDSLIDKINEIKESGIDIKVLVDKILDNLITKAVAIKKKGLSTNAFKQIKAIIDSLNNLLSKLNSNSNGYLMLELELISFISDESNALSNREINQIISREIITDNKNVEELIKENTESYYKVCNEFINVRVNNSFVNANKNFKVEFLKLWENFVLKIKNENIKELLMLTKNIIPQVVSDKNVLFLTSNESNKVVCNSKLYEIENQFNKLNNCQYKMIFITKREWDDFLKDYDKDHVYNYEEEDSFINDQSSSVKLAEDLFGNESINIE